MLAPEQGCKVLRSVQLPQLLQLQHEQQRWNGAGVLAVLGMRPDDGGIERERKRHRFTNALIHTCMFPKAHCTRAAGLDVYVVELVL